MREYLEQLRREENRKADERRDRIEKAMYGPVVVLTVIAFFTLCFFLWLARK